MRECRTQAGLPLPALPSTYSSWASKRASTILPAMSPMLSDFKYILLSWLEQAVTLLALAKCINKLILFRTFSKIARMHSFIFHRRLENCQFFPMTNGDPLGADLGSTAY